MTSSTSPQSHLHGVVRCFALDGRGAPGLDVDASPWSALQLGLAPPVAGVPLDLLPTGRPDARLGQEGVSFFAFVA